jgi:hypothetical protein
MPHLLLPGFAYVGMLLQQFERQADQVIEVHTLVCRESFFITRHDARRDALVVALGLGLGHGGVQALVFPQTDGPLPFARGGQVRAAACIFQDRSDVIGVEDAEIFLQTQHLTVLTQHAHAQSVKRTDQHLLCRFADQLLGAFAHFSRGLVGERDGRDPLGRQTELDQMRNFVGDHPCFA